MIYNIYKDAEMIVKYKVNKENRVVNINTVEILEETPITRTGKLGIGSSIHMCIEVDGDGSTNRGWGYRPYFKVYLAESKSEGKGVARIYFDSANYVTPPHNMDRYGNKQIELNSKEKKILCKVLSFKGIWDFMNEVMYDLTMRYIDELKAQKPDFVPTKYYQMPNYKNL